MKLQLLQAEAGSSTFVLKQGLVFLYDGWNMFAEIDITQTQPRLLRSYEWGVDVSETMDGAGGVGGLLVEWSYKVSSGTVIAEGYAPCYDGNGNVMALVTLSSGELVGQYEYGAFGETVSMDGDWVAQGNAVRFSTKYWDAETGLLYYTHRYYEAATGRWLNRDPIEEDGGVNLYGFVENVLINSCDVLGCFDEKMRNTFLALKNNPNVIRSLKWIGAKMALESLRRTRNKNPPQKPQPPRNSRLPFDPNNWAAQNEWGGLICMNCNGSFAILGPAEGTNGAVEAVRSMTCPASGGPWLKIAFYHSHPDTRSFSDPQQHDPRPGDKGCIALLANYNNTFYGIRWAAGFVAYSESLDKNWEIGTADYWPADGPQQTLTKEQLPDVQSWETPGR